MSSGELLHKGVLPFTQGERTLMDMFVLVAHNMAILMTRLFTMWRKIASRRNAA